LWSLLVSDISFSSSFTLAETKFSTSFCSFRLKQQSLSLSACSASSQNFPTLVPKLLNILRKSLDLLELSLLKNGFSSAEGRGCVGLPTGWMGMLQFPHQDFNLPASIATACGRPASHSALEGGESLPLDFQL
jgi:hypothetical protein